MSFSPSSHRSSWLGALCALLLTCPATVASAQDPIEVFAGTWGSASGVDCSTSGSSAPAQAPQLVSQLLPCTSGDCLHQVSLAAYPNAVCNDGSPGAFYIRPGIGDGADKWIIHLQGGAGCTDYEECLQRWCGQQGIYDAAKMSSSWDSSKPILGHLPDKAEAPGHMSYAPLGSPIVNDLSEWNHVWVYYCSSDGWVGRQSDVVMDDGNGNAYTLDFRGHTILGAVRQMLRQQGAGASWSSEDGEVTQADVPKLDAADTILFTGTSAGGIGAVMNADWFLKFSPTPKKYLVVDAALDPLASEAAAMGIEYKLAGGLYQSYETWRNLRAQADFSGFYTDIDAFWDESCLAFYSSEPWRCMIPSELLSTKDASNVPLIRVKSYIRHDLGDAVLNKDWKLHPLLLPGLVMPNGFGGKSSVTLSTYAQVMRNTLWAIEGSSNANVQGVFGPYCGQHVGLEDGETYLLDGSGTEPTLADLHTTHNFGISAYTSVVDLAGGVYSSWVDPGTTSTCH